jgi:hypothetical protein
MMDTEQIVKALAAGSELAAEKGEGFVLAITAAYMAGIEAGKLAATGAA